MMEGKTKMIKGLIYDDKDMAKICTVKTVKLIDRVCDEGTDGIEDEFFSECPNLDEFKASMYIEALINRNSDNTERNLIIPTYLIGSDELREDLERMDIGEDVLHGFIDSRVNKYADQSEKRYICIGKFNDETGEVVASERFDNISDAIKYVTEAYENNEIGEETLSYGIKSILEYADDIK